MTRASGDALTPSAPRVRAALRPLVADVSAALLPLNTRKNRLPIPDVFPRLSVTIHAIVWMPLLSVVVSNASAASAVETPGYCDAGNSPTRSLLAAQPVGVPTAVPSIRTVTAPPPGTSARRGARASTQPKVTYMLPLTVSPGPGVSIAPNGCVDVALVQVIVLV